LLFSTAFNNAQKTLFVRMPRKLRTRCGENLEAALLVSRSLVQRRPPAHSIEANVCHRIIEQQWQP